ncbi:6613_t:CDS:2 [Entrophospora sp. SA101]|nr:6613_t:CDS:2 [Entrophospora sp. SA101]
MSMIVFNNNQMEYELITNNNPYKLKRQVFDEQLSSSLNGALYKISIGMDSCFNQWVILNIVKLLKRSLTRYNRLQEQDIEEENLQEDIEEDNQQEQDVD